MDTQKEARLFERLKNLEQAVALLAGCVVGLIRSAAYVRRVLRTLVGAPRDADPIEPIMVDGHRRRAVPIEIEEDEEIWEREKLNFYKKMEAGDQAARFRRLRQMSALLAVQNQVAKSNEIALEKGAELK